MLPKLSGVPEHSGVPELLLSERDGDATLADRLHNLIREPKIRLFSFVSLISASGAFAASRRTRELISARIAVTVKIDVRAAEPPPKAELARRKRRVQSTRSRLPYTPVEGPLRLYVHFPLAEVPLRVANLNRTMASVIPMVDWTAVSTVRFTCRNDLESLDPFVKGKIAALGEVDMLEFLEEPAVFRNLERLTLSLAALSGFPDDFCVPRLRRLKLFCRDASFTNVEVACISRAFPKLQRLHLAMVPSSLAPFTSSGFVAPRDFRITVMEPPGEHRPFAPDERKASVFVASHLMTLPFAWSGLLFQNVTRLQMAELCRDQAGLAMEELCKLLKLPQLRRLGTVSLVSLPLLDVLREESNLEELVLVMDLEHANKLFRHFLAVEQQKRRCSLTRLSVHLLADDGVGRPRVEVETAVVAGFYLIATTLLRPHGYLSFSHGNRQLSEMALAQLAWFRPSHFCVDWTHYADDKRLPSCTPNERPLPYHSTEGVMRPRGTLVAGTLRRETEEELAAMRLQAEEALLSEDVDSIVSRKLSASRRVSSATTLPVGSRPPSPRARRASLSPAADSLTKRRSSAVMTPGDTAPGRRRPSMSPVDVAASSLMRRTSMSPADAAFLLRRTSINPVEASSRQRTPMSQAELSSFRRRASMNPAELPTVRHLFLDMPLVDAYEGLVKYRQEGRS